MLAAGVKTCSCLLSLIPMSAKVTVSGTSHRLSERAFIIFMFWFPGSWDTSLTPPKTANMCGSAPFCIHLRAHLCGTWAEGLRRSWLFCPLMQFLKVWGRQIPLLHRTAKKLRIWSLPSLSQGKTKPLWTDFIFQLERKELKESTLLPCHLLSW